MGGLDKLMGAGQEKQRQPVLPVFLPLAGPERNFVDQQEEDQPPSCHTLWCLPHLMAEGLRLRDLQWFT